MNFVLVDWATLSQKKPAYKFPLVASDILSVPNNRVVDFFSGTKLAQPFKPLDGLIQFFVDAQANGGAHYNYTRSGYVCKILNPLILHRSGLLAKHILLQTPVSAIVDACHCRSASMTVLNLITLIASSAQTPMMMAAPASLLEKQNEPAVSAVAPEIVAETLDKRQQLFKEVIDKAIESANNETKSDLHSNLVWVVSQVLIKPTAERASFVKLFNEKLPAIVKAFVDTFPSSLNNRLGNLFLVALETQSKDQAAATAASSADAKSLPYCLPDLPSHMRDIVHALVQVADAHKTKAKGSKIAHSFSTEMGRLNPKIYKILEAVNVSLRLYISNHDFVEATIQSSGLERHIFDLFIHNPFNNILHNQLRKLLVQILERGTPDVVDVYFANNPGFVAFIDHMAASPYVQPNAVRKIRQGFIGQAVAICTILQQVETPGNNTLFDSCLIRSELAQFPVQIFRPGVRNGKPGFGGHRLPLRQP